MPSRRTTYLTAASWIASLEVGGPYDIPAGLNLNTVRTMAQRAEGKTFSIRKPSAFRPPVVYRVDDGARPAVPTTATTPAPRPSKHRRPAPKESKTGRARAPGVDERIMALKIGQTLSLAKNEYGARNRAAAITQTTGRQFSVDVTPSGKVLTRRG